MSREVMQQALEVLEASVDQLPKPYSTDCSNAITALRAALKEPEQEPIKWELNGDDCGYTNWLGITPFGRILITWKGWKEHHDATVDEFPGGFEAYGSPDEVKAACEAEYAKRLGCAHPPQRTEEFVCSTGLCRYRKPLTDEEIDKMLDRERMRWSSRNGPPTYEFAQAFARAIEAAHGIKQENTK